MKYLVGATKPQHGASEEIVLRCGYSAEMKKSIIVPHLHGEADPEPRAQGGGMSGE